MQDRTITPGTPGAAPPLPQHNDIPSLAPASLPPQREAIRLAVNRWIRTGGAFDGVVDFDAALRDPADPTRLRRAYDSGDHIHPSDAGYAAMGAAVPAAVLAAK